MAARWMTASTPSRALATAFSSQTSPLISSKKRFWQQGSRPCPPNSERVEDADAVPLLQEHRDQRRADVAGSAGDENSHGETHPWLLGRAWNVEGGEWVGRRQGETGANAPGPVLAALITIALRGCRTILRSPERGVPGSTSAITPGLAGLGDTISKLGETVNAIMPRAEISSPGLPRRIRPPHDQGRKRAGATTAAPRFSLVIQPS